MTLKKLLLATAAVAMTATTANALAITVNAPAAPVTPALELEFPGVGQTALQFDVDTTTGSYPAGDNLLVTVRLPAGVSFANAVVGANVTDPDNGANVSATVRGTTGQVNDTTVDLLISIPQTPAVDTLRFDFQIKLDSCPAVGGRLLSTTITTEQGTNIEQGTVSPTTGGNVVLPCEDAVSVVVLDDEDTTPAGPDTFIELPDYDSLSDGQVGQVNGIIDGTIARNVAGDPVEVADIEDVDFVVNIPDVTGIDSFTFLGTVFDVNNATDTATGPVSTPVSVAATAGGLTDFFDATGNDITLTETGTAAIATQQLSISGVVVDFLDAVTGGTPASDPGARENFVATEAQAGGNIDLLQREGQAFGYFDWVGGDANRTVTVLRATGMPTMTSTPFTITFENAVPPSLNGQTFTGTYNPANATGDLAGSGEFTMNTALGMGLDTPPTFLRADILVNFETNADIDVDRLMARNGIITNYGDGANNSYNSVFSNTIPNFDSDNTNGTE